MDDADNTLPCILADCATAADLDRYVIKHAIIVQHLVSKMAKEANISESKIRTLYATWADMAVEEFEDTRLFSDRKLH
jgi:hypothetical protein